MNFSCHSKNVIYLITCTKCEVQYVGLTRQKIKERIAQHIRHIKNNSLSTYLVQHFNNNDHSISDLIVKIIDYLPETKDNVNELFDLKIIGWEPWILYTLLGWITMLKVWETFLELTCLNWIQVLLPIFLFHKKGEDEVMDIVAEIKRHVIIRHLNQIFIWNSSLPHIMIIQLVSYIFH